MSIPALINSYGRTVTRYRPTFTRDAAGAAIASTTAATATASFTAYLQSGSGGVADRYGRLNTQYAATLYALPDKADLREGDTVVVTVNGATRTYRVDSVRIPDDRPTGDALRHLIANLTEDLPRT
jgi:hypothetical protein